MKKWAPLLFTAVVLGSLTASKSFPVYTKNDLTGNLNPASHADYVRVADRFTNKTTYMRKAAYEAFLKMRTAAAKDGIHLIIVSGTRNRERQIEIWTEKWNRFEGTDSAKAEEILLYSSMPGTSRHHWGTDIDLNSVDPEYFTHGTGAEIYEWLHANAEKFGYFQPYIKKGEDRKEGYREEKWHWSYFPISDQLLTAYKRMVKYQDLQGFPGADVAPEIDVFNRFVQGIPDLNAKYNGFYRVAE